MQQINSQFQKPNIYQVNQISIDDLSKMISQLRQYQFNGKFDCIFQFLNSQEANQFKQIIYQSSQKDMIQNSSHLDSPYRQNYFDDQDQYQDESEEDGDLEDLKNQESEDDEYEEEILDQNSNCNSVQKEQIEETTLNKSCIYQIKSDQNSLLFLQEKILSIEIKSYQNALTLYSFFSNHNDKRFRIKQPSRGLNFNYKLEFVKLNKEDNDQDIIQFISSQYQNIIEHTEEIPKHQFLSIRHSKNLQKELFEKFKVNFTYNISSYTQEKYHFILYGMKNQSKLKEAIDFLKNNQFVKIYLLTLIHGIHSMKFVDQEERINLAYMRMHVFKKKYEILDSERQKNIYEISNIERQKIKHKQGIIIRNNANFKTAYSGIHQYFFNKVFWQIKSKQKLQGEDKIKYTRTEQNNDVYTTLFLTDIKHFKTEFLKVLQNNFDVIDSLTVQVKNIQFENKSSFKTIEDIKLSDLDKHANDLYQDIIELKNQQQKIFNNAYEKLEKKIKSSDQNRNSIKKKDNLKFAHNKDNISEQKTSQQTFNLGQMQQAQSRNQNYNPSSQQISQKQQQQNIQLGFGQNEQQLQNKIMNTDTNQQFININQYQNNQQQYDQSQQLYNFNNNQQNYNYNNNHQLNVNNKQYNNGNQFQNDIKSNQQQYNNQNQQQQYYNLNSNQQQYNIINNYNQQQINSNSNIYNINSDQYSLQSNKQHLNNNENPIYNNKFNIENHENNNLLINNHIDVNNNNNDTNQNGYNFNQNQINSQLPKEKHSILNDEDELQKQINNYLTTQNSNRQHNQQNLKKMTIEDQITLKNEIKLENEIKEDKYQLPSDMIKIINELKQKRYTLRIYGIIDNQRNPNLQYFQGVFVSQEWQLKPIQQRLFKENEIYIFQLNTNELIYENNIYYFSDICKTSYPIYKINKYLQ